MPWRVGGRIIAAVSNALARRASATPTDLCSYVDEVQNMRADVFP